MSIRMHSWRPICDDYADRCCGKCDDCRWATEPFDDEEDDSDEDWNNPGKFDDWRNGVRGFTPKSKEKLYQGGYGRME